MMTIEGQCLLPVGRQRTGRSREEVGRGEDRQINDKSSIIMRVGQNGRKNDFSRKRSTLDFEEYLDPKVRVARLGRQALLLEKQGISPELFQALQVRGLTPTAAGCLPALVT